MPHYTLAYLKNYFWQGIAFVLGFLSMFIVSPKLTSVPSVYGIYCVCISLTLFISYSDFGFLTAGAKFASEAFAQNERNKEYEIIGFTAFVQIFATFLFMCAVFIIAIHPQFIVKGLQKGNDYAICQKLLLILAFSAPLISAQRILQLAFSIRVLDFVIKRLNIAASLLTILSSLYFFSAKKYDIVGFYLSIQIFNLLVILFSVLAMKSRLGYDFLLFVKNIRLNKAIFNRQKHFAITSFAGSILWFFYFEIDLLVVGKLFGAVTAAQFGAAGVLVNFFRNVNAIIFAPFSARLNHFKGLNDLIGMRQFALKVMQVSFPLTFFPVLVIELFLRPFIINWVGPQYNEAINLARILLVMYVFINIQNTMGILLSALEKLRETNYLSIFNCLFYWTMILSGMHLAGVYVFAYAKVITILLSVIFYLYMANKLLGLKIKEIFTSVWMHALIPITICSIGIIYCVRFFPIVGKNKMVLSEIILTSGLFMAISIGIYTYTTGLYTIIKSMLPTAVIKKELK